MKMYHLPFFILTLFFLISPVLADEDQGVYQFVHVNVQSNLDISKLQVMGLDIVLVNPEGYVEIVAREHDLIALGEVGCDYEVKIEDMETFFEERALADPSLGDRAWPDGSMGGFPTFDEIVTMLDDWALQYPDPITAKTSIGTSHEGRDIWAVKVSDNPNMDEDEPEVSFDSLIHAREPASATTILYYIKNLLEQYGIDPELTYLVDNRELWFIPVHNPDGYRYNQQISPNGGGMWRKNRKNNGDSKGESQLFPAPVGMNRLFPLR